MLDNLPVQMIILTTRDWRLNSVFLVLFIILKT